MSPLNFKNEDFDFLKREEAINFWQEEFWEGKKYYEEFLDHFLNQLRFPFYRFREINKSRIDDLYKLACDFLEDGDYKSAKTYFSLGFLYDHNNILFWKGMAETCMNLHLYKDAINAYDRTYEISQEASTLLRCQIAKLALREQEKTIS